MLSFKQYLIESQKDLLKSGVSKDKLDQHVMSHETLSHIKQLHDKVFGVGIDHVLLKPSDNKLPSDVEQFLLSVGINTSKKTGNHLVDSINIMYNNRVVDLMKFLSKNKAPASVITSAENYHRPIKNQISRNQDYKILISRKKAEIAAASTCTSWKSCLSPFNGPAWDKIPDEIKYGTLIAYVLRASATPNEDGEYDANGPDGKPNKIGRVMIKMFESDDGDMTFATENKTYGDVTNSQLKTIKDWVKNNYHTKEGTYTRSKKTYKDSSKNKILVLNSKPKPITAVDKEHLMKLIKVYEHYDDLNFIDVSNITNMSFVFSGSEFNGDISNWDVSNVTDMSDMFSSSSFNSNISNWDVSNVTNMSSMFENANDFNINISRWNVSNVTDMSRMFRGTYSFNQSLKSWDVSNVTNMSNMFENAKAFNGAISLWDVSKVTNMNFMFKGAESFHTDIDMWDVSKTTSMRNMFYLSPLEQNTPIWYKE